MKFSIVVPVFNKPAYTRLCLEALIKYASEAEIIVVDNGSLGLTRRILDSFPVKVLRNESNLGAPAAMNQGIKAATGEYVVLLHNDCVVTSAFMSGLRSTVEAMKGTRIRVATPSTNYCDENTFIANVAIKNQFIKLKPCNKLHISYEQVTDILEKTYANVGGLDAFSQTITSHLERTDESSAFCIIAPKSLFDDLGGFEESFKFRGFEEKELTLRLQFKGWEVGKAGFYVHHFGNITSDGPGFSWKQLRALNEDVYKSFLRAYAGLDAAKKWTAIVFPDTVHPELQDRLLENLKFVSNPPSQIIKIPYMFPERNAYAWALPQIQNDYVFPLDSDMLMDEKAPDIILQAFSSPNVGAVFAMLRDPCMGQIGYMRAWRTSCLRQIYDLSGHIKVVSPDSSMVQIAQKLNWGVERISDVVGEHAIVLDPWNIFRMYFRRGLKQRARGRIGTPAGIWGIEGAFKEPNKWSHIALVGFHLGITVDYDDDPHDYKFDELAFSHYLKVKDFCETLAGEQSDLKPQAPTTDKINVALMCESLEIGGMEMFVKLFDELADRSRFNVFVYSRLGGPLERVLKSTIRLAPGPVQIAETKMFKWLCDDRIDVAIVVTYSRAANVFRGAKVCQVIERLDGVHIELVRIPGITDVVVFQSEILAQYQKEKYEGLDQEVIYNGRDLAKFARDEEARRAYRAELGLSEGDLLIGHVGRLHWKKNQTQLVRLAAELRKRGKENFKIAIMGPENGEGPKLRAAILEEGVSDKVIILDGTPEGPPRLLSASDIYAHVSVGEGLSGALLEALAAGLPIVATNVGATREAVDRDNGALVLPNSEKDLADAVEQLFDTDKRSAAAAASLSKSKKFDAAVMVRKYEDLIQRRADVSKKQRERLPLITVVIPVWNREKYLDRAIESVLAQTTDQWRLLIAVDTLEPSREIMAVIEKHDDPRISYLKVPHKNQCSAINNAMRAVQTPYVCRLDSDDLLVSDALETMINEIKARPDVGYFYSARIMADEEGNPKSPDGGPIVREAEDFSPQRLEEWFIARPLITWKNVDFVRAGGFAEDIPFAEDYYLPLMMMLNGTKFKAVKKPLYIVRYHGAGNICTRFSMHEQRFFVDLVRDRYAKLKKLMAISWAGEDCGTIRPRMRESV